MNFNGGDSGLAISTAAAATINHSCGSIFTEILSTPAGQVYQLTLTNDCIQPAQYSSVAPFQACTMVASVYSVGNSTPGIYVCEVKPFTAGGGAVINIMNGNPTLALNGTIVISFVVF